MGICHGWSAASIMTKRPTKTIYLPSFDKKYLSPFYPSDIKALNSLLWAKGSYKTQFIGGRCHEESPTTDDNNRATNPDCLDNNPATLHLALIHQIGINKQSMIMDATLDYEVWNQPIISYNFKPFNPINQTTLLNFKDAIIELKTFIDDPYKKYRSKKTKYLIGINVEIIYAVETTPNHSILDNGDDDDQNTASYYYDLELDKNFNIVGGEWYGYQHPDFLWMPAKNSMAKSAYDYYLLGHKLWNGESPIDNNISNLAKKSAKKGQPLAYIIESLIELSNSQNIQEKK